MTLFETILITYILLNWFLTIIFVILPKRIINKVYFLFIIICPPLIIGVIGEAIKRIIEQKKEKENE